MTGNARKVQMVDFSTVSPNVFMVQQPPKGQMLCAASCNIESKVNLLPPMEDKDSNSKTSNLSRNL
jgi:hypothetical protein